MLCRVRSHPTRTAAARPAARPQVQVPKRNVHANTAGKKLVTLIPGDGVGPEIANAAVGILQAANAPVEFERFDDLPPSKPFPADLLVSIARNAVVLKGPFATRLADETISRNLQLRKLFDQQVEVVPLKTLPGIKTRHGALDVVVIRENVEGEYSGLEHEIVPGIVTSNKIATAKQSEHVARFAFNYAKTHGRKKITAIHKANIMKLTDGLFLECVRKVASEFPDIAFNEMIVDNTCMQLVQNPGQFDIMVTPNLYGNIVTNVATGLIGGPGVVPGANFGGRVAFFEPGSRHIGGDIAGKNKANPTALTLSACLMLDHLGFKEHATKIEKAIERVYSTNSLRTPDLLGTATTTEFTQAIISQLKTL